MADSMQTRIRYPLSGKALDALIKTFKDVYIEKECVFVYSRGFVLHEFLIAISAEHQEEIVAEHMSSIDQYTTLYVERYRDGASETIETKKDYLIYFDDRFSEVITDELIEAIRTELKRYEKCDEVQFTYDAGSEYSFKVTKTGYMVKVDLVEKKN